MTVNGRPFWGAALALIAVSAMVFHAPHWFFHRADTNFDFYIHYNWVKDFADSLSAGTLYPRWAFESRFGLGEPTFVFYAPLYYLLAGAISNLGVSVWSAMQLVEWASSFAMGCAIYALLIGYVRARIAILVAIAVISNPFAAMLHYKFNGFAWASVSMAAQGAVAWAILRPGVGKRIVNIPAIASVAVMIYSHILGALVCLIVLSMVPLLRSVVRKDDSYVLSCRPLLSWCLTVSVGLLIAAAYWVPALGHMNLISSVAWRHEVMQAFAWPTITALVYGVQWFGFQWPIAFPGLMICAGLLIYLYKCKSAGEALPAIFIEVLGVTLIAFFLSSELSFPFWMIESPLRTINLPYRFLSWVFLAALLGASVVWERSLQTGDGFWGKAAAAAIVGVSVMGFGVAWKASLLDGSSLVSEVVSGRYSFDRQKDVFMRSGALDECGLSDGRCRTMQKHLAGTFGGIPEYEIADVGRGYRDFAQRGFVEVCATTGVQCRADGRNEFGGANYLIKAPVKASILLPVFDFPAWVVLMDGKPISHQRDLATGLIRIAVVEGEHSVTLRWGGTKLQILAERLTALGLVGTFIALLFGLLRLVIGRPRAA